MDSLSRWGEFEVCGDVFQSMQRSSRWGKAAGAAGYTVDLYASPLDKQCTRYCSREAEAESAGGETGCLGDARLVKLSDEDNVWACPPLADCGPDHGSKLHRDASAGHYRGARVGSPGLVRLPEGEGHSLHDAALEQGKAYDGRHRIWG